MALHRRDFLKGMLSAAAIAPAAAALAQAGGQSATAPAPVSPAPSVGPALPETYLKEILRILQTKWPRNRLVNIVCHGHSVPAGYFKTPLVDTFNAYPHLLHEGIKRRFPFAVANVIVTAIGGENSRSGAARFQRDVLCHRPDVVTIDYALNDRAIGLPEAKQCWTQMVRQALAANVKVLLLTGTSDITQLPTAPADKRATLQQHAQQIRALAKELGVGLVDSLAPFEAHQKAGGNLMDLLSQSNHPNRRGHELVAKELLAWFPGGVEEKKGLA